MTQVNILIKKVLEKYIFLMCLMKRKGTEMCNLSCTASYMISQSSGSGPELARAAGVNMVLVPAEAGCQSGAWWSHDHNLEVNTVDA